MTLLKDILGYSGEEVKTLRTHSVGSVPRSKYIALAFTNPGAVKLGDSYTLDGQATKITPQNIALVLKDLAFEGVAHFFGDGTVNGSKGKPTEITANKTFGSQTRASGTGEVNETVEVEFEHYFHNIPFFNDLRKNTRRRDIFLFTDNTVQIIRYTKNKPQFHDLGYSIENDMSTTIQGGFSFSWADEDGELVPYFGVNKDDLDARSLTYTFTAPTLTDLTLESSPYSECPVYRIGSGTGTSITRTINEKPGNGQYFLYYNVNEDLPSGVTATISQSTGKVDLTTIPTGRHKFTVAYENEAGVFGTYCFEVIKG